MTAVVSAPPDSDVLPDIAFFIVRIFLPDRRNVKKTPGRCASKTHLAQVFSEKFDHWDTVPVPLSPPGWIFSQRKLTIFVGNGWCFL